jgi:hypothetical protein
VTDNLQLELGYMGKKKNRNSNRSNKSHSNSERQEAKQGIHQAPSSQGHSDSTEFVASPLPSEHDGNTTVQQAASPGAEIPVRKSVYSRDKSQTPERRTTKPRAKSKTPEHQTTKPRAKSKTPEHQTTKPRAKSKTPERKANQLTGNGAVTLAEGISQIVDDNIKQDPHVHTHTDGLEIPTAHVVVDQTNLNSSQAISHRDALPVEHDSAIAPPVSDSEKQGVTREIHQAIRLLNQIERPRSKKAKRVGRTPLNSFEADSRSSKQPVRTHAAGDITDNDVISQQYPLHQSHQQLSDNDKSRGRYSKKLSNGETIRTDHPIIHSILDASNHPLMIFMLIIASVCSVITLAAIAEQSLVALTVPAACLMMFFYFLSTLSRFLRELDLAELDRYYVGVGSAAGMFKQFEWLLCTRMQNLDMSMLYIGRTVVNYYSLIMIHLQQIVLSALCILPDLLIQCALDYFSVLTLLFFNFLAVSELIDCILSPLSSLISRLVSTLFGSNTALLEHQANPTDALVYKHGFASYSLLGTIADICTRSLSIIHLLMNSVIRIAEIIVRPLVHTYGLVCPESALRVHKCINHHALITENIFADRDKLKAERPIEDRPDRVDWSPAFGNKLC